MAGRGRAGAAGVVLAGAAGLLALHTGTAAAEDFDFDFGDADVGVGTSASPVPAGPTDSGLLPPTDPFTTPDVSSYDYGFASGTGLTADALLPDPTPSSTGTPAGTGPTADTVPGTTGATGLVATLPADPASLDAAPADTALLDAAPVDPALEDPALLDPALEDPALLDTAPAATTAEPAGTAAQVSDLGETAVAAPTGTGDEVDGGGATLTEEEVGALATLAEIDSGEQLDPDADPTSVDAADTALGIRPPDEGIGAATADTAVVPDGTTPTGVDDPAEVTALPAGTTGHRSTGPATAAPVDPSTSATGSEVDTGAVDDPPSGGIDDGQGTGLLDDGEAVTDGTGDRPAIREPVLIASAAPTGSLLDGAPPDGDATPDATLVAVDPDEPDPVSEPAGQGAAEDGTDGDPDSSPELDEEVQHFLQQDPDFSDEELDREAERILIDSEPLPFGEVERIESLPGTSFDTEFDPDEYYDIDFTTRLNLSEFERAEGEDFDQRLAGSGAGPDDSTEALARFDEQLRAIGALPTAIEENSTTRYPSQRILNTDDVQGQVNRLIDYPVVENFTRYFDTDEGMRELHALFGTTAEIRTDEDWVDYVEGIARHLRDMSLAAGSPDPAADRAQRPNDQGAATSPGGITSRPLTCYVVCNDQNRATVNELVLGPQAEALSQRPGENGSMLGPTLQYAQGNLLRAARISTVPYTGEINSDLITQADRELMEFWRADMMTKRWYLDHSSTTVPRPSVGQGAIDLLTGLFEYDEPSGSSPRAQSLPVDPGLLPLIDEVEREATTPEPSTPSGVQESPPTSSTVDADTPATDPGTESPGPESAGSATGGETGTGPWDLDGGTTYRPAPPPVVRDLDPRTFPPTASPEFDPNAPGESPAPELPVETFPDRSDDTLERTLGPDGRGLFVNPADPEGQLPTDPLTVSASPALGDRAADGPAPAPVRNLPLPEAGPVIPPAASSRIEPVRDVRLTPEELSAAITEATRLINQLRPLEVPEAEPTVLQRAGTWIGENLIGPAEEAFGRNPVGSTTRADGNREVEFRNGSRAVYRPTGELVEQLGGATAVPAFLDPGLTPPSPQDVADGVQNAADVVQGFGEGAVELLPYLFGIGNDNGRAFGF